MSPRRRCKRCWCAAAASAVAQTILPSGAFGHLTAAPLPDMGARLPANLDKAVHGATTRQSGGPHFAYLASSLSLAPPLYVTLAVVAVRPSAVIGQWDQQDRAAPLATSQFHRSLTCAFILTMALPPVQEAPLLARPARCNPLLSLPCNAALTTHAVISQRRKVLIIGPPARQLLLGSAATSPTDTMVHSCGWWVQAEPAARHRTRQLRDEHATDCSRYLLCCSKSRLRSVHRHAG